MLDVLQDAVRLLKNKLPSDRRQGQENRTSCIDDEGLSLPNQFAKLGVIDSEAEEEASDLVLDLIASSPNTAYSRSVKAAFDLDDKTSREEEYMFMKICLLEEVEEIEAILTLEWIGYTLDKKGLVRAALMTNAAVDIVRQQEESMRRHVDFLGWDEKFVSDCEEKFFSQLALTSNGNLEEPLMGMRKLLPETLASPFPKVACGDSGAKHPPQAVSYFDASADAVPTHNATTTQRNVYFRRATQRCNVAQQCLES